MLSRTLHEKAARLVRECERRRRETQLTILFAATQVWRARNSLRLTRKILAEKP
jgi:hypothetical protein